MRSSVVVTLAIAVGGLAAGATAVEAASPDASKPALASPPQEIVEAATRLREGPYRYNRNLPGGGHTNGAHSGGGVMTLAVAAYAGNQWADGPLLRQIRHNLIGENAVTVTGGYPAQHERHFTGAVTVAKFTPRIWAKLTDVEKAKIDLLMKAALVASAYTTSDAGYAGRRRAACLDGNRNMHRDWNPNYREGMVGMMLVGAVYFGPTEAQRILDTYDHARMVAALRQAGLTNPLETFTWAASHPRSGAPTPEQITAAVRNYRYKGHDLSDPMGWYHALTTHTYGAKVNAGLNGGRGVGGAGRIASGAEGLPNVGSPGMLKELDGRDGGGPRSSIGYAYDGFRPNLTNQIVLIVGGYWKPGPKAAECLKLMDVGVTDLFYKLQHGYINYSKGRGSRRASGLNQPNFDFVQTRSLWYDVVRPYHVKQGELPPLPQRPPPRE